MTGTDTGAGKTYVSALVIQALRAEGVDAVGYKPICCGGREDAYTLLSASDERLELDEVNPCYLRTAAAPYVAAMFENAELELEPLIQGYHQLAAKHEVVVVEGVGGWKVPILKDYMVADFAKELGTADHPCGGQQAGCAQSNIIECRVDAGHRSGAGWTCVQPSRR